jgi:hypothetical protein
MWPTDRVVIADDFAGGKPIIAITSELLTPIFANYDTGVPFQISDSLEQFFLALATLVDIIYGKFAIFEIEDHDGLRIDFVTSIEDKLKPLLGEENYQGFFDYFYG